jgi:hypothetical protein
MGNKVPGAGYPSPAPPKGAALYEATGRVFVNGRLHEPGDQFRSAEKPGRFWRLIEEGKPAPAKAGKAAAKAPADVEGDTGRAADQSPI